MIPTKRVSKNLKWQSWKDELKKREKIAWPILKATLLEELDVDIFKNNPTNLTNTTNIIRDNITKHASEYSVYSKEVSDFAESYGMSWKWKELNKHLATIQNVPTQKVKTIKKPSETSTSSTIKMNNPILIANEQVTKTINIPPTIPEEEGELLDYDEHGINTPPEIVENEDIESTHSSHMESTHSSPVWSQQSIDSEDDENENCRNLQRSGNYQTCYCHIWNIRKMDCNIEFEEFKNINSNEESNELGIFGSQGMFTKANFDSEFRQMGIANGMKFLSPLKLLREKVLIEKSLFNEMNILREENKLDFMNGVQHYFKMMHKGGMQVLIEKEKITGNFIKGYNKFQFKATMTWRILNEIQFWLAMNRAMALKENVFLDKNLDGNYLSGKPYHFYPQHDQVIDDCKTWVMESLDVEYINPFDIFPWVTGFRFDGFTNSLNIIQKPRQSTTFRIKNDKVNAIEVLNHGEGIDYSNTVFVNFVKYV